MPDPPSLAEQEAEGLLREEVQRLVDGVLEDVRHGKLTTRPHVRVQCEAATERSRYATDVDYIMDALRYGASRHVSGKLAALAFRSVMELVVAELAERKEYQELPE